MLTIEELEKRRRENLLDQIRDGRLRRIPRTRPRDPDEVAALSLVVQARVRLWRESGKFVPIGPRRWFYRYGEP